MSRALALIGVVVLSGCYAYLPQRPGTVPVGSDVRVHLSPEGVQNIGAAYGSASGILEGRLESWGDTIAVTVPVAPAPGMIDRGLRNRIIVRQADVLGVDLRQRDQTKTLAVSVGLGGVVAIMAIALFGGTFGGSQNEAPPLPEDIRMPSSLQVIP